jgi:SAM-dependent methyltransferase
MVLLSRWSAGTYEAALVSMRANDGVARNRSMSSLIIVNDAPNRYSPRWSQVFLLTHDAAQAQREVEFLKRQLPLPRFRRVLDVCCGVGRHAAPLAEVGYELTGVDRDENVLAEARRRCPRGRFVQLDMRQLDRLTDTFDAVICMWQSFGYFDAATNESVLAQMANLLNGDGRVVLDVCNLSFFEAREGVRRFQRAGTEVIETTQMLPGGRQRVSLEYSDGQRDEFDWQLFTAAELTELAARHGLQVIVACSAHDESQAPSASVSRMQLVFSRSS